MNLTTKQKASIDSFIAEFMGGSVIGYRVQNLLNGLPSVNWNINATFEEGTQIVHVDNFPTFQPVTGPLTNAELRAEDVGVDATLNVVEELYTVLVDEASPTITYIGEAPPGSALSAAVWRIKKIDSSSGFSTYWAGGDTNFDNIWNNRAALVYT